MRRNIVFEKIIFQLLIFSAFAALFFLTSCGSQKKVTKKNSKENNKETNSSSFDQKIQNKYATQLGVSQKNISNISLYTFIDKWYGVPYKYGGKTMNGIDCSDFVSILFNNVYEKNISGSAAGMYNQCKKISMENLREGDLIFFKIGSSEISHIGIYLQNNKFVHATVHRGIMIDDLNEAYYKKYFFACGRFN
ncbi:MAG: C40 family peptidase [Bacteroidia bacterium]